MRAVPFHSSLLQKCMTENRYGNAICRSIMQALELLQAVPHGCLIHRFGHLVALPAIMNCLLACYMASAGSDSSRRKLDIVEQCSIRTLFRFAVQMWHVNHLWWDSHLCGCQSDLFIDSHGIKALVEGAQWMLSPSLSPISRTVR